MSSAEVVFWLSLFGIDIGLPLMLPERFRFQTGAILVSLSTVAFFWSVGFRPDISQHLGIPGFAITVLIAGAASLYARIRRERDFESIIFELADSIAAYGKEVAESEAHPVLLPIKRLQWTRIVDKYNRKYGRAAARLMRELSNPSFIQFANEVVTHPDSVKSFAHIAGMITSVTTTTASQYRTKRLVKATVQGIVIGTGLFVLVLLALSIKSGELQEQLNRLAGVLGLALKRPPVTALQHPAIALPKISASLRLNRN